MPDAAENKIRILFICLGNICRSPMAEGIMTRMIEELKLTKYISVASCGIGNWAMGHAPDKRAILAAAEKDADISGHRKALLGPRDLGQYDYFIAMDGANLNDIPARNWYHPFLRYIHLEMVDPKAMPMGETIFLWVYHGTYQMEPGQKYGIPAKKDIFDVRF
jgi:protein-tyrosine-phosphatase